MARVKFLGQELPKRDAEALLARQDAEATKHREYRTALKIGLTEALNLHKPFLSSRPELSDENPYNLQEVLAEEIGHKALFCLECRTKWPCRSIPILHTLRRIASEDITTDDAAEHIDNMIHPRELRDGSIIEVKL